MDTERICKEFDTIDRLIISGIRHDGDKIILPCVYKSGDDDYLSLSAIKTVIDKINTGDEQVSLVDFSVIPMGVENIFTDTQCWIVPNLFVRIELEEATQSPKSTTSPTKLTKKQKVLAKTNRHCAFCGTSLTENTMTIDHIVPKVQGGTKALANCYAACQRCNSLKSNKSLKHFVHYLQKKWIKSRISHFTLNNSNSKLAYTAFYS